MTSVSPNNFGYGTSGQIVQSKGVGTPPNFTTATYPSTATGTGKILRADGTNWSATTATYPDTAGTSGNVLTSDGTNWNSTAPTSKPIGYGYKSGYYYNAQDSFNSNSSLHAVAADTIIVHPWTVNQSFTISEWAINVQSASSGSIRLGLYNTANGFPTTVLTTFGTVNSSTNGWKTLTPAYGITPGFYFVAIQCSATPTLENTLTAPNVGLPVGTVNAFLCNGSMIYTGAYSGALIDLSAASPASFYVNNYIINFKPA